MPPVAPPVAAPCGSTVTVYVPVAGSVLVSTNIGVVANSALFTSMLPPGFAIETYPLEMLEPLMLRLIRWPAVPLNVSFAFWPGVPMSNLAAAPPGALVPVTSGGHLVWLRGGQPHC